MQSMIREEVGLYWLYSKFDEHAGLIPFPEEACKVLRRLIDAKEIHSFTFTPATSARRLVEHWLDTGRLPMRHRGRVIDEQLSGVPAGEELSDYVDLNDSLDGQTIVRGADLIRLMLAEKMTVPSFLLANEAGLLLKQEDAADAAKYKRAWELSIERDTWMNMEHQNDPDKFEKIQSHLARIDAEWAELGSANRRGVAGVNTPNSSFLPKQRAQEQAILAWLTENNWDARALPKPPQGKPGVKAAAWEQLQKSKEIFGSRPTFDKAWERLRGDKLISDEE